MLYLSIAIIVIGILAAFLVNKWMSHLIHTSQENMRINNESTAELTEEFRGSINKITQIETELTNLKNAVHLRIK